MDENPKVHVDPATPIDAPVSSSGGAGNGSTPGVSPVTQIKGMQIPAQAQAVLKVMNRRHAFIGYGGKTRFLDVIEHPGTYELPYQFLDAQTFSGYYQSDPDLVLLQWTIARGGRGSWEPVYKPVSWVWLHWPGRRRYRRVGFYPGRAAPSDVFNLWEGWRFEPRRGSWKRLLKHIYEVICRRDRRKFKWLIDWLSHLFQTTGDPTRRSPVSPVVWGKKGGGKSLCFDHIADCFGNHGMTVSRKDQLTGKFNKHLMMSLFVVAEEAVYAHDRQGEGPLKDLLTRKTLTVEPKNVDAFLTPNFCRFAFVSNEELAVPMTLDERRYQPFEISPHRVGDTAWFEAILDEMRNGGYEAMMYDLLNRRYDENLLRYPLEDSADLHAMRAKTLPPTLKFAVHWIANGRVVLTQLKDRTALPARCSSSPANRQSGAEEGGLASYADAPPTACPNDALALTDEANFVRSADLKAAYDLWCRENLDQFELRHAPRVKEQLVREIREALPFIRAKRSAKARGILLPPAEECRSGVLQLDVLGHYMRQIDDADGSDDDAPTNARTP